jgi:hypothetical protein
VSALEERRRSAREAYHDARARINTITGMPAVEEAIESATRVEITKDITDAARQASGYGWDIPDHAYYSVIEAAFRAAGFEVVT